MDADPARFKRVERKYPASFCGVVLGVPNAQPQATAP